MIDFGLTTKEKEYVFYANEFFCSPNKVPLGLRNGGKVLAEKFDDIYALTMTFMAMEIEIDKVYFGYDKKNQIKVEITEDVEEEDTLSDNNRTQENLDHMIEDVNRKKTKDEVMIDCISRSSSRQCRQTIFENCKTILEEEINGTPRNEFLVKIIKKVVVWDENDSDNENSDSKKSIRWKNSNQLSKNQSQKP